MHDVKGPRPKHLDLFSTMFRIRRTFLWLLAPTLLAISVTILAKTHTTDRACDTTMNRSIVLSIWWRALELKEYVQARPNPSGSIIYAGGAQPF
jgi:hypothetical protein